MRPIVVLVVVVVVVVEVLAFIIMLLICNMSCSVQTKDIFSVDLLHALQFSFSLSLSKCLLWDN